MTKKILTYLIIIMLVVFTSCQINPEPEAATYTVSYDANGATSGTAPTVQTKTEGTNLMLATNTGSLAKTNYSINGWNTESDGSGTSYSFGGSYATDADEILYAEWSVSPSVSIAAIAGVPAPVIGAEPVTEITETDEYTGTVSWDGTYTWATTFAGGKAYTATITLTPKDGYSLIGVSEDFFTLTGASSVANTADSGVITAVFPATSTVLIGSSFGGGVVGYILQSDDTGYTDGEQRGLVITESDLTANNVWALPDYKSTAINMAPIGYAMGTGAEATARIVDQNGASLSYAAGRADACTNGGYTDWFLPSYLELEKVYLEYRTGGVLDQHTTFTNNVYWSSAEVSATKAYCINFNGIGQEEGLKDGNTPVRAFRYF